MAVRKSYRLPFSLNSSAFDMAISLSKPNSLFAIRKPITVKVFLTVLLGLLLYFILITQTPLGKGGLLGISAWSIGFIWLLYIFCMPTMTKELGLNYILPAYAYTSTYNRNVYTRSVSYHAPVQSIVGIEHIDEQGIVQFTSGEVGYVVELVGNASDLMFEEDTMHVLASASKFYSKIGTNVSYAFDYVIAPQRVDEQVDYLTKQREQLQAQSEGLLLLNQIQREILTEYVGNSFKSLHQYAVVRAKDAAAMQESLQWLRQQLNNNTFFISSYRVLPKKEAISYLRELYCGVK